MKVLILSAKDDNGGIGIAIKRAFDKYAPEHEVRSVTREDNFIGWEKDIFWRYNDAATGQYVSTLFDQADVIHIMDTFDAVEPFGGLGNKPAVMHHHGLDFRRNSEAIMARCRREDIPQIAAVFDILKYGDDIEWLPNPVDIHRMQGIRANNYWPTERPLVVQTPTSAEANGTNLFLDGVGPLVEQGVIGLDLVRGIPWVECMKRKARADIVFDSFKVGYGLTAIEAFAMGIPVICGASDEWVTDRTREEIGYLPYYDATPDNIGEKVYWMARDSVLRGVYAEKAWATANDFHDERKVVGRLISLYERTIEDHR